MGGRATRGAIVRGIVEHGREGAALRHQEATFRLGLVVDGSVASDELGGDAKGGSSFKALSCCTDQSWTGSSGQGVVLDL